MSPNLESLHTRVSEGIRAARQLAGLPIRLSAHQAAAFLGYESHRSLERRRREGTGPRFQVDGGRVYYLIDDLVDWARAQPTYQNNSQARLKGGQ